MLRLPAIIVAVLSLSLVMACTPVAEKLSPTAVAPTAAPKSAPPPTSAATPQPPAPATSAPKAAPPPASAATPQPAAEKPQRGGTLNYAMTGEPGVLDPHKVADTYSRRATTFMFNTLADVDERANVIPELAESWSTPDANTYVFKLRKGVKFHDGTDFDAQAVKFNIERVLDPATKSPESVRGWVANVKSVDVLDDYTVRFNLKGLQASFLLNLSAYAQEMFSPAAAKKWGADSATHPVGTGPFELVEWVKGDHITLKRFDGYWRKDQYGDTLPYLDGVTIKFIPDSSVMVTNLRTGNLDLMEDVSAAQMPLVQREKDLKTMSYGGVAVSLLTNCVAAPFNNKALRQAVAWAVDREAISKALYGGAGLGAYLFSPKIWAFDPSGKFYTRDLAKAREKLAEGGKPSGFKFALLVENTPSGQRLAQVIKSQLVEIGIDMEIVPVEQRDVIAKMVEGKFEASLQERTGSAVPDPDAHLYRNFHTQGTTNWGKCGNSELDKLAEAAAVTYDKDAAKAIYAKAQALALDVSGKIFLYEGPSTAAMGQRVMGIEPPINFYYMRWDGVWIKK